MRTAFLGCHRVLYCYRALNKGTKAITPIHFYHKLLIELFNVLAMTTVDTYGVLLATSQVHVV